LKILFHTQYYPPEIGAPQSRLHELAVRLVQYGFSVTVLTAMPNYPLGKIYAGYGGLFHEEKIDGVRVLRAAIYPSQKASFLPRLLSYFSFVFSSLFVGLLKVRSVDVVLTESPPLFLGISGYLLSRFKRARWIFNLSDLWPQSALELGIVSADSWGYRLSLFLEAFLYQKAWLVSAQSCESIQSVQARFPNIQTYHLPNGVDTTFFQPAGKLGDDFFRVVYAGLHGLAQGLGQVIQVAQKLSAEKIEFVLIGDGPEKQDLINMARDLNLSNVHFLPPVPKEKVPEILHTADALLVPLKIQLTGAVPSKLYESMAIGKPVLLVAQGEAASIVLNANCGMVVAPGDIDALAQTILFLKANLERSAQMGKNGRQAAVQNHDRDVIAKCFADFLSQKILEHR
jgi:glycosyltransferase involved in cell wall biosynthesis